MDYRKDTFYFINLIKKLRLADNGCWEFQGGLNQDGYGNISYRGKQVGAHRLMMILTSTVDGNLVVDHICKNRKCCNPSHLRLVTPDENTFGTNSNNPAAVNSRKTHCKNGHPYSDENTFYIKQKNGKLSRKCKECNRRKAARGRLKKGVRPKDHSFDLLHLQQFCESFDYQESSKTDVP